MAAHSHRHRLLDIREEIAGIIGSTSSASIEEFAASWAMRRAVEHALLIIAEAAKHIPDEEKLSQASIPWRKIHGLGNLLRHEYRRVDPEVLWSVITDHLVPLDRAVVALLARMPE
ncbi:MAG: DUF86 domain-containing protein [Methylobacterium frigidaeris]